MLQQDRRKEKSIEMKEELGKRGDEVAIGEEEEEYIKKAPRALNLIPTTVKNEEREQSV